MIETIWEINSGKNEISKNEVHIWRIRISNHLDKIPTFRQIIAADELTRADRYYFEKDRNSFTVSRGFLRTILGKYTAIEPEDLQFKYNQYGKPELENSPFQISFNLSHSGDLALLAIGNNIELGVDVELIRDKVSYKEICVRFFSPAEVKALCDLSEALHKEAFFNGWTRKEAYIKAKGKGLAIPLNQFDVSLVPGQPALLLDTRDEPQNKTKFLLYDIQIDEGYKAALVTSETNYELQITNYECE